jgi:tetratricopeptide (TPR) repeat protein/isopentenyldiphosphate isomerase
MREFVGRKRESMIFDNMLHGESENRILNVTGIGGIGKSTLVEEFGRIARDADSAVAVVNARRLREPNDIYNYPVIVEVLAILDRELRASGCELRDLDARLRQYRVLHQQVTQKFPGNEQAAVSAILQVGVSAIRAGATVFPVAQPLAGVLTPELATKVSQVISAFRKKSDQRLLARPIEELTTLFVSAVNAYRQDHHNQRMVLIFDEFELIQVTVEQWLRRCFSGEFGKLDDRLLLVLAGRAPIGQDWIARGQSGAPTVVRRIQLERFSDNEVADYLIKSQIDISPVQALRVASELNPAYRLPLALRLLLNDSEWLDGQGWQRSRLGLLADEIVDRLLDERVNTSEQRKIALSAAVARRFDSSTLRALNPGLDTSVAQQHMMWLTRQHFINPHAPTYSYYDLVRDIFMGHLENTDRVQLYELHNRLRIYYEQLLARGSQGERMHSITIEHTYHSLSAAAGNLLPEAFKLLFNFLPVAYDDGISWSRMVNQVVSERDDLDLHDRECLRRLAVVVERSSMLGAPTGDSSTDRAADPALNILFASSFDDSLPVVTTVNAEHWLTYFESRFKIVAGMGADMLEALTNLLRLWDSTQDLIALGSNENLLAFRVASDLADIYARNGDLPRALDYSRRAISIARSDGAPIREAFALYLLSNNQKRHAAYRQGLDSLSAAISLVRQHPNHATPYYLGRFLLDKAVTLTYIGDTVGAEEAFQASRASFSNTSPVSYAELSHRLGWLKRVRGDLPGALADHETAVGVFREVSAGPGMSAGPSNVSYLLAKALHSMGNVYVEMCQHETAQRCFDEALGLFERQGGVRHEAIVRKDRAWSRFVLDGWVQAEEDIIRAVTALGPTSTNDDRPAVNSATHLADGWLVLSLIRAMTRRLDEAEDAVEQARALIGNEDNLPMLERINLQVGLIHALRRRRNEAETIARATADAAMLRQPQDWLLAARATTTEAIAAAVAGDHAAQRELLSAAEQQAAQWNEFGPTVIREFCAMVAPVIRAEDPSSGLPDSLLPPVVSADLGDEIIDVYDEHGALLGQASSRLAHSIGLWHRAFHCWIARVAEDGTKLILLQRRGPHSRNFPNFFDMSAAGHHQAGEDIEGGIRECREELGIEVSRHELLPVARRVINETHPNGHVNREFQSIYLLVRPVPARLYRPGFPEVSSIVECPLEGLIALVDGSVESIPFSGVTASDDTGEVVPVVGRMTRADLIASSRAYHNQVFPLVAEMMDRIEDGTSLAAGPTQSLADGSQWTVLA